MLPKAMRIVSYLIPEEVYQIADACDGRGKERDELLILTLFETGLRVSEALEEITLRKIRAHNGHSVLYIKGRGAKPWMVACPDNLDYKIQIDLSTQGLNTVFFIDLLPSLP